MGRFLLLVLAGAVIGSYVLSGSVLDRASADAGVAANGQNRSLAREAAEAAQAVVVGDLVDPATGRFRGALTLPQAFQAGGGQATVEDYSLSADGREATVRVAARVGTAAHRFTSTYRLSPIDWLGPMVLETPYASANVEPGATIRSEPASGDRGVYVDVSRFDDYDLSSFLSEMEMAQDLRRAIPGEPVFLLRGPAMAAARDASRTPTAADIRAEAIRTFRAGEDTRIESDHVVSGTERYGSLGDFGSADPRIVIIKGDLRVPFGARLEGNGVLIVEGDLRIQGDMTWEGLVVVSAPEDRQHVEVDLGDAELRGSLLVDQEAPPPGGHTDLTVFRSLDGTWEHPAGDGRRSCDPATVTGAGCARNAPTPSAQSHHYEHTHRVDNRLGSRRFVFHATDNVQQQYTRFKETVADLLALPGNGNLEVVLEFANPDASGAADYALTIDGATETGVIASGFNVHSPGERYVTEPFKLRDFDELVVDVRSLRMLERLWNGKTSDSPSCDPTWSVGPFVAGCTINERVSALSHMRDRDGALTIRVARASDRAPLYEAALYWHTRQDQSAEEEAADQRWREDIRSGTADYGTELRAASGADIRLDLNQVQTALQRIGLGGVVVEHVQSQGESIRPENVRP